MKSQRKRILIIGGYGMLGSNIARLIRNVDPSIELILSGRNPLKGEQLSDELKNAETAYVNLEEGLDLSNHRLKVIPLVLLLNFPGKKT